MRVPQQERSSLTRTRVLDAAVKALLELGYANTTAAVVADRAGVSRGAMQYHFRTKSELLAAAVEHLAASIGEDLRLAARRLPEGGQDRVEQVIDLLRAGSTGDLAIVWMELNLAARTERELHQLMEGVDRRLRSSIRRQAIELFGADPDDGRAVLFIDMSLLLLSGLSLARGTAHGRSTRQRENLILAAWQEAAPVLLAQTARAL